MRFNCILHHDLVRRCKRFAVTQRIIREVNRRGHEAFFTFYMMWILMITIWISSPSICGIVGLLFARFLSSRLLIGWCLLVPFIFIDADTATLRGAVTFMHVVAAERLAMFMCSLLKSSQCWLLFLRISLVVLSEWSFLFEYAIYDRRESGGFLVNFYACDMLVPGM